MFSYVRNMFSLARGNRNLQPRLAIYYVTGQCNLNCPYCEDFGARRNDTVEAPVSLDEALKILRVIRSGVSRLWLTGGEPLLVPHIDELVRRAKTELKFSEITLITNGTLLVQHESILPNLDRLVISLDSVEPRTWQALNMPDSYAENILSTIQRIAGKQKEHRFRLAVNAVITPETLANGQEPLRKLIDFCTGNKILVSFSPQSANNWPSYELLTSPEYKAFIQSLIKMKKHGAPILGSLAYLRTLPDARPYECYPTLVPRIMPNGDLTYPCRPIEKANGEQGGRPVNLHQVESWSQAWGIAYQSYGEPPSSCGSCFQQCYAEPSLMQARPLTFLAERLRFSASRQIDLSTYAPG